MRIIVINLDEDSERREYVEGRLRALGLRWERLPAIDGRHLARDHEALVDRRTQAARGLRISPGDIGCWMSHRTAHRMVAEGPEDMALVLEDDLRIEDDLPAVLDRIEQGAAGRFDVIRLHRFKLRRRYVPIRHLDDEYTIGLVRPTDAGTQAYIITRKAAERIIHSIPRMVHIADHALYEHWTHGLIVCSIDPPVVYHCDSGRSSIAVRPAAKASHAGPRQWLRRKGVDLELTSSATSK